MSKIFFIKDIHITNWEAGSDPTKMGKEYWDFVSSFPDEPLIEATMKLVLSYNEYQVLLKKNRQSQ